MKREILLPAIAAGILVAFTAVSLLVWVTRGRNGRLVRRKLALGALLIGLTAVATGCDDDGTGPTCYAPPPPANRIELPADPGTGLVLDLSVGSTVEGTIYGRQGTTFSFRILRLEGEVTTLVQSGDIAAADGAYDQPTESFAIQIDTALVPGDYSLRFYTLPAAEVEPDDQALYTVSLQITLTP